MSVTRRALSGCAAALALLLAATALVGSPPFLERLVLADHDLGGPGHLLVTWFLSGCCALLAWRAAAQSRRLWKRAGSVPARPFVRALLILGCAAAFVFTGAEVYLRRTHTLEQVLSGDAYWIRRWYSSRTPGSASLGTEELSDNAGSGLANVRNPGLHRPDPELGWVPVGDYRSDGVTTNSRGLRGQAEHAVPKPAGEERCVVIGDSFTWGMGVRDEETWPALLESLLPGLHVINLAVSGYGTDQQYLRLLKEGFRYEPDLVIVGFFGPDSVRNVRAFRSYAKPFFELDRGELRLTNVPVPGPDEIELHWARPEPLSYACTWLRTKLRQAVDQTTLAPKWGVTLAILDATLAATREHGARFLLAHFPSEPAAFRAQPEDSEILAQRWADARGQPFVGLRAAFLELPPAARADVFRSHWTPAGNLVVARSIARAIAERRWIESERR